MKPDWDTLMDEFKDSKSALIADVDCTTDGKELCTKHDVRGYPTIKHGDPADLKDYNGGRDLAAFKKFAEENLGPSCGLEHLDLCDDESKAFIEQFQKMDDAELDKTIEAADGKLGLLATNAKKAVDKLEAKIAGLNKDVEAATKKKEDTVAKETKKTGLRMMKAALAEKKKKEDGSDKKKGKKKSKK